MFPKNRARVFLALWIGVLTAVPAWGHSLSGRVVKVLDGDTIVVLDAVLNENKVRLLGIDAPEKKQAFGSASKTSLSELVFGKEVRVEYKKRDRYGRILGKVIYQGKDINLEQIRSGLAWHYKQYQREQAFEERQSYATAEDKARELKIGLWQQPTPIPPWASRHTKHKEIARP
ncbi:MAG: thermonuclease family protein [Deltaproteobacteria bacterium]|nr:thermonuclease family protein [Deltaproteobacteria bacterium]